MVVALAPAVYNICESFTHNPQTWAQGNPTLLSLMVIHKKCIAYASGFESYLGGGQHGCVCFAIGNHQYALHSQTT